MTYTLKIWRIHIAPPLITYTHPTETITVEVHPVNSPDLDYRRYAQELLEILYPAEVEG